MEIIRLMFFTCKVFPKFKIDFSYFQLLELQKQIVIFLYSIQLGSQIMEGCSNLFSFIWHLQPNLIKFS